MDRIFYIKGMEQNKNNFIKLTDPEDGREIGFVAVERGSDIESYLVDKFLDGGFHFEKATESDFANYEGKYIKRLPNAIFCAEFPMEEK